MGKAKQNKSAPLMDAAVARRAMVHVMIAVIVVGGGGYCFYRLKDHVMRNLALPAAPPKLVLSSRPAWMSDSLASEITASAQPRGQRSAMDHQLLCEITQTLTKNPWVREVIQVRRVFGQSAGDTVEADCQFRTPVALVATQTQYILVDGEGCKLPERFARNQDSPRMMFGPDGRVNIRVIDGVAAAPPAADGQKWMGEDLAAGLDMAKYLFGRPCTEEIYRINVSNFKGRRTLRDPQITLVTRYNSEIRWGEPIRVNFHAEVSPEEKMNRMAMICDRFGRVDGGHSWIDIRLDKVMCPKEEATVAAAGGRGARTN